MRALNEFLKMRGRLEDLWERFCCENCPHWRKYRLESQVRGNEAGGGYRPVRPRLGKESIQAHQANVEKTANLNEPAIWHNLKPDQDSYQVHVDGRPTFDPKEDLELVRNQARSAQRALLGTVTIINIRTNQEIEI